jgi:hypothetical protein
MPASYSFASAVGGVAERSPAPMTANVKLHCGLQHSIGILNSITYLYYLIVVVSVHGIWLLQLQ